jgi:ribosome modulation factor
MSPSYDEGYKAFLDGKPVTANPYCFCNAKADLWDDGWIQARTDKTLEAASSRATPLPQDKVIIETNPETVTDGA